MASRSMLEIVPPKVWEILSESSTSEAIALHKSILLLLLLLFFSSPAQSQQAEDIVVKALWPQRCLFNGESAAEGDRIPTLQGHWQPVEQEACFP